MTGKTIVPWTADELRERLDQWSRKDATRYFKKAVARLMNESFTPEPIKVTVQGYDNGWGRSMGMTVVDSLTAAPILWEWPIPKKTRKRYGGKPKWPRK